MKIEGKECRALWFENNTVKFIDQRKLPYKFEIYTAKTVDDVVFAIKDMVVRGAPAIGAAAVYGMVLGGKEIEGTAEILRQTRPTAHDLFYGIAYMVDAIENGKNALEAAHEYVEDIIKQCCQIGEHGEKLIKDGAKILTHCNAGALATVDYGTALAPLRLSHKNGKDIFVYVFMKNGDIDLVITGADRIANNGDIANKIGTYEKAVIAKENDIPFYVAAPTSTFDKSINDGSQIIIEERSRRELSEINGKEIMPNWTKVKNPAFDVTPAKYITGYITEYGIKRG